MPSELRIIRLIPVQIMVLPNKTPSIIGPN